MNSQIYIQPFLLFLSPKTLFELVSDCGGQNYSLVDCVISMSVGRHFFIEKNERHSQKRLLSRNFEDVTLYSIGNLRGNTDIKYHFHSSGIFLQRSKI